jgi:hypothetical protein
LPCLSYRKNFHANKTSRQLAKVPLMRRTRCKCPAAACHGFFAASLLFVAPVQATEYGFSDYALGYGIPMAGYTPPPGVYFSDTFYLYSASATTNGNFPFGNITAAGVKVNFITNVAATAWYTDFKIFGGTLGFGALVPVGSDTNSAAVSFIGPSGSNRQLNRTDSVVSIGDSAYSASLGWETTSFMSRGRSISIFLSAWPPEWVDIFINR